MAHAAPPTVGGSYAFTWGAAIDGRASKDVSLEVELQPKTLKPERLTKYSSFVSHAEQLDIMCRSSLRR
jgi:hypothetical protein